MSGQKAYPHEKLFDNLDLNSSLGESLGRTGIADNGPKSRDVASPSKPPYSTTRPAAGHKIYPYLLRNVAITRPDQVWSTDITYVPMCHGFLYLVAVIDRYSRYLV